MVRIRLIYIPASCVPVVGAAPGAGLVLSWAFGLPGDLREVWSERGGRVEGAEGFVRV